MALTAAEEAELAALEAELNRGEQEDQRRIAMATAAARAGGGGMIAPPLQGPEAGRELAVGAVRYGVPLAAGIATGGAGIPAMIGAGLVSAAAGEAGAQAIEKELEGKEYRPREIGGAAIRGAVPFIKGAPVSTTALSGLGGLLGGAAEGKVTGFGSGLRETVLGAAPIGALQAAGAASKAASDYLSGGIRRAADVEQIGPGVRATVGQAFPEFAGLESRVASQTGSQELRQQLQDQSKAIASAVQNVMGVPAENYPDLVSRISRTIGGFGPETAARLANEAQNVNSAFAAVEKARTAAQKSLAQDALAEAQQAFQKAVEVETLKGGIRGGGVRQFQSAIMGREVEDVLDTTRNAFKSHAEGLYGPVKKFENTPAFDLGQPAGQNLPSVEDEILGLMNKYPALKTGQQSAVFTPYLRKLEEILNAKTPASLNDLRAIRDQLYDASDIAGQAFGKSTQRDIRNVANRITQTIDSQAPQYLGQAEADALRTANKFYSEFRPRFDEFGVIQAFKPGTMETAQMADLYAGRVARQGTETPAFQNASSLLQDLQSAKVAGVPAPSKLSDITRAGIVDRSIDPATGAIDLTKLASDLNNIAKQGGGGLQQLGFGTTQELNRFVKYVQDLDPAKSKGPEAVLELLKTGTPAGFSVASAAVRRLPDVATVDSVMQTLQRQAVGGSKQAADALTQIRAREIEDLLLKASSEGRVANLGSLTELADPAMRDNVERILGRNLMGLIDSQFIPGFRVIEEARQAAGMAGSTVRGAAIERVGRAVAQAPTQIAAGDVKQGIQNMLGNAAAALGYNVVAKVFAKGAGVSGLRKRQDFVNFLEQIAKKPAPQQIQLLRRYSGEEDSGE